jgi:hypothetical protein
MFTGKIAVATAAVALAALIGQSAPASADWSDANMRYASQYVGRAADALQQDNHDYGGHRAAAVTDIGQARADIAAALAFDNRTPHTAQPMVPNQMVNASAEAAFSRTQEGSDRNLSYVRNYLERAIDILNRDRPEYNGYRLKAIRELQAARSEIVAGQRYDNGAPGSVRTGTLSDSNVRTTRSYVERGIDMLQHDRADYGGHRVSAITYMQRADSDLLAALRADRADESVPAVAALSIPADWQRTQAASNQNLLYGRTYVEHAIDMLQRDQHDYNGYRVKAIANLQSAREQLLAAINFR